MKSIDTADILLSEAQQFAKGLRELTQFYETYQGTPLPPSWNRSIGVYGLASPHQIMQIARAQGALETKKDYTDETFFLRKVFSGGIELVFTIGREQICRKVVKGTREVPETIVPAKTIPAHTEEIVEWECSPLLAPAEPPALTNGVEEGEVIEAAPVVRTPAVDEFEDIPF